MKTTKAEDILNPHTIRMAKVILGVLTVSETEKTRLMDEIFLEKWFGDANLEWVMTVEVNGKHYKLVYSHFMDRENKFEINV